MDVNTVYPEEAWQWFVGKTIASITDSETYLNGKIITFTDGVVLTIVATYDDSGIDILEVKNEVR